MPRFATVLRLAVIIFFLLEASTPARAYANTFESDSDTNRLSVGLLGATFTNAQNSDASMAETSPALWLSKPLWMGKRYRYFQWELEGNVMAAYSAQTHTFRAVVAPEIGFNLYLGSVFGLEYRLGLAGFVQANENLSFVAMGASESLAYVFRLWDDDRQRLKLLSFVGGGGPFATDNTGNVEPVIATVGVGLVYEMPL